MKIKKNDTVLIISGKDKGKQGKVLDVFPKEERIVVEGINLKKKLQRPKKSGEKGQMVTLSGPLNISNAKLICPGCKKPTRVGYKITDKRKTRICKKCKQEF